ncbi:hypothetical protein BV25DRAFT_1843631 [Artomyces pyxidatus]|uniref:Uncharacterized protein n=1 Tax=Artomyces pyxidatus TaxID=48021 RepID=A0ACB8SEZ2_9AGAM|nr:hypothetical protein BV25DRAFT_1843631 [Artomyces pyxidatus]
MAGTKRSAASDSTTGPDSKRTRSANADYAEKSHANDTTTKEPAKSGDNVATRTTSDSSTAITSAKYQQPLSTMQADPANMPSTGQSQDVAQVPAPATGTEATSLPAKTNEAETTDAQNNLSDYTLHYAQRLNCPERLIEILPTILAYSNPKENIYAAAKIPSKLMWRDNQLSVPGSPDPIKIWIVGEVDTHWFFDGDGRIQKRVSVRVLPIQREAIAELERVVKDHTEPVEAAANFVLLHVLATAFSTERKRGAKGSVPVAYDKMKDGRASFSFNRSSLPSLAAEFLTKGDTVIQEVTVGRYKVTSPDKPDIKRISFKLESITVLWDGTKGPVQVSANMAT